MSRFSQGRGFPYGVESDNQMPGFVGGLPGPAPENIGGIGKKTYRVIRLDLTNARSDEEFRVNGTLIQVVEGYDTSTSTPDADVNCTIRFNDRAADAVPFYPGQAIGGLPFDRIYLTNDAQADKRITFLIIVDNAANRVDVE